ncbi:MAG: hypothetical protein AAGI12_15315 [Pseudomonadota bacterium]
MPVLETFFRDGSIALGRSSCNLTKPRLMRAPQRRGLVVSYSDWEFHQPCPEAFPEDGLVEMTAQDLWREFARLPNADKRWDTTVKPSVKEQFRDEARAKLKKEGWI